MERDRCQASGPQIHANSREWKESSAPLHRWRNGDVLTSERSSEIRGHSRDSREPRSPRRGSVTLVSLCLTTTLGIALASYLALSSRSAQLSNRSLNLDRAQQLAQVGLEEALWALNQNNWSSAGADGTSAWSLTGSDQTATVSYPLSGGVSGQLVLKVANYASTGPTWPTITANATVTLQGGQTFAKSLQATTGPLPVFGNAIASSDAYVSFTAAGTVDSWNSDPDNDPATPMVPYSFTAGNPINYQAVIAGKTNGTYGVVLTQATVCGYVATYGLPVSYSSSGSPPGSIVGPNTAGGATVDTARIGKCAFVPLTDVVAVSPPDTHSGGNHYGVVHNAIALANVIANSPKGVFRVDSDMLLTLLAGITGLSIDKPKQLVIDGDLTIGAGANITVTATGSLEIFVSGEVNIGGDGLINLTNDPKKLAVYVLGSSDDPVVYSSTHSFCGVIFCENRPIEVRENATFMGAMLSKQYVKFTGNATSPVFHYDAALRNTRFAGISTPYVIKKVTEL